MSRRTLFKIIGAALFTFLFWRPSGRRSQAAELSTRNPLRRVRPTDPSWPNAEEWEKLNRAVGGNLIKVESPLAACKIGADNAACQEAIKNLQNPYYIGEQPGGTQTSGWVDAWMSAPSVYAVATKTTSDVVAAVNFAREHNLRVVVKGGGHSYQGTSNAPDSLLIWTRNMQNIQVQDAFVAQGCEGDAPQPAVTVEAGALWMHVYDAVTTKTGRYVQGGGCATVGVAGLVQSGGFGSFSKNYGTAAAGLLEAEIVIADGQVLIANAKTNPDLFWAVKGGGGGSFGVITRLTLRTHELSDFFGNTVAKVQSTSDAAFQRLISQFFSFYHEHLMNPHWGESISFRPDNSFEISMLHQGLKKEEAAEVWKPFFDWVTQSPQDFTFTSPPHVGAVAAQRWWDTGSMRKNKASWVYFDQRPGAAAGNAWWTSNQREVGVFLHGYESAWLPVSLLEEEGQKRFTDALFAATRLWEVGLHFNKGLAGSPAEAVAAAKETATNPAVLTAFALAIIAGGSAPAYPGVPGHEPDLVAARKNAGQIKKAMEELTKVIAEPGSYVSESNYFNEHWQQAFWGPNYPRLKAIKAKYDPEGFFTVHHGVEPA